MYKYSGSNSWAILAISASLLLLGCQDSPDATYIHDERGIYAATLSDDADRLLIASVDKSAQLWDFKQQQQLHKWTLESGQQTDFSYVSLAHDGSTAVTADQNTLLVWDTASGQSIAYWSLPSIITGLKASEHGKYALVSYVDRSAQLIDLKLGQSVWTAKHAAYIEAIDLSQDSQYALIGCDDNTATLWDIPNGKRVHLWEEKTRIRFVAISPNNRYAVTSAPFQTIKLWDIKTGKLHDELREIPKLLSFFSRPLIHITSAAFSDREKYLVVGAPPRNIYLWDLENGKFLKKWVLPKHLFWKPSGAIVYATAISDDNQTIYAEASNGRGYQWKWP